jgi:hypothetical protein
MQTNKTQSISGSKANGVLTSKAAKTSSTPTRNSKSLKATDEQISAAELYDMYVKAIKHELGILDERHSTINREREASLRLIFKNGMEMCRDERASLFSNMSVIEQYDFTDRSLAVEDRVEDIAYLYGKLSTKQSSVFYVSYEMFICRCDSLQEAMVLIDKIMQHADKKYYAQITKIEDEEAVLFRRLEKLGLHLP